MGKSDIAVWKWLSNKVRFADLFNGVVFSGEQVISPEKLELISGKTGEIVTDKNGMEKGVQRYRDIAMRWKDGMEVEIFTVCSNITKIRKKIRC